MSAEVAKIYDLSTGKEIVDIRKTQRKTFHVMEDGTMTSYMDNPQNASKLARLKSRGKKALNYFFDLED